MTLGKNKGLQKKGKAIRKADKHAFTKKEWFKLISAPTFGNPKPIGWVPGNTTIGKKKAETNVENRICEVNYTDVAEGDKNQQHWRSVRIQVEKVENNCLYTSFVGMNCAREKIYSILKKRQTLIETFADVKTQDGSIIRVFSVMCTLRSPGQHKVNSYAQTSQVRRIRKLVTKILTEKASKSTLDNFTNEILTDSIPNTLSTEASKIFPIKATLITKVRVMKKAKIDLGKLVEESQMKKSEQIKNELPDSQNTLTKEVAATEEKK